VGSETTPSNETKDAERAEAAQSHTPDRDATTGESAAAEQAKTLFEDDAATVAAHEEEMMDIGAHVKGEGEID
jgi:hypothetical protein